jgi:hypothetical protein
LPARSSLRADPSDSDDGGSDREDDISPVEDVLELVKYYCNSAISWGVYGFSTKAQSPAIF